MARRSQGFKLWKDPRNDFWYARFTHAGQQYKLALDGGRDLGAIKIQGARVYDDVVSGRHAARAEASAAGERPFDEVAALWLSEKKSDLIPKSFTLYRDTYVGVHFMAHFKTIGQLTTVGVDGYRAARLREVKRNTVVKELSALRQLATWAHQHGQLPAMPLVKGPGKKVLGTASTKISGRPAGSIIFTEIEISKIIAKLPVTYRAPRAPIPYPVRDRFVVLWETGLRPETISSLRAPDDYRRGAAELVIRPEADKNRFGRQLPLSTKAREALDRICPEVGRIFGRHDYRLLLRRAAKAAGIDSLRSSRITEYDFRHSRMTHLGQSSANLNGMMFLAGWTQPATAAKYMKPQKAQGAEVLAAAAAAEQRGQNDEFSSHSRPKTDGRGENPSQKLEADAAEAADIATRKGWCEEGDSNPHGRKTASTSMYRGPPETNDSGTLGRQETSGSASKRLILVPGTRIPGDEDEPPDPFGAALARAQQDWASHRDQLSLRRALEALIAEIDDGLGGGK